MNMPTRAFGPQRCNDRDSSRILILLKSRGMTGNSVTLARKSVNLHLQQLLLVNPVLPVRRIARATSVPAAATQTIPVVSEGSRALSETREYRLGAGHSPLVGTQAAGTTRPAGPSTGKVSAAGPRANRPSFHGTYEGQHLNVDNSATAELSHLATLPYLPKTESTTVRGTPR